MWRCTMCKWLYKDQKENVKFADLPEDWKCPVCKAEKGIFEKVA
ncbi:MAG: rubredoxin [Nitrospira sp.]|nr:rubredoxin [Nitrospira sp.]